MANGLLNIDEVKQYLDLESNDIDKLIKKEKLSAYKIGGEYLRFRKEQVIALKTEMQLDLDDESKAIKQFFKFFRINGFYIITSIVLVLILYFILI